MSKKTHIIGHRGYGPTHNGSVRSEVKENFPENSLEAFRHAIENGADGVELDIFISKSNIPIVIHDDKLEQHVDPKFLKGVNKKVRDNNYSVLKNLNIGGTSTIPSLATVFHLVSEYKDRELIINLDVKDRNAVLPVMRLVNSAKRRGMKHEIIISSYDWDILRAFREQSRDIKLVAAVKSKLLFGEENVKMPGYVPTTDEYDQAASPILRKLHKELNLLAIDCTFTDFKTDFIDWAKNMGVGVVLSTAKRRVGAESVNYEIIEKLDSALKAGLPFSMVKVDEPDKVKQKLYPLHL